MTLWRIGIAVIISMAMAPAAIGAAESPSPPRKKSGIFMSAQQRQKAIANAEKYPWAKDIRDKIVARAQPWMSFSDDELWDLVFGATLPRSWMVWSNGFCPACKKSVPMYTWKIDALARPWKVQCPHCKELFPKNDFQAFYRSGLDEHGVFDPKLADRSLLYNTEHPDPKDPLRLFGVDDGTNYVEGQNRWRFIGAYLIYGQWKQAIVGGASSLGAAYAVTGDPAYAHKAGILLDRVADLYPTFDFRAQAEVYEIHQADGYVSTWHDACGEVRELAVAYDEVFDAIKTDAELARFLAVKAKRHKLENTKTTFADIQRNIEDRILRDSMANRKKIESNYPQTDLDFAMFKAILDWPESKTDVSKILGDIIEQGTAKDGVSGEKGMCCYASWAVKTLAEMLELFSRVEPGFLSDAFKQHPNLYKTWQFYIDAWCLQNYYPNIGDSTTFVNPGIYAGVGLGKGAGVGASGFTFLDHLYDITKNPAYMQIMYIGNGNSTENLPYDIFASDPCSLQKKVKDIVDRDGLSIKMASANKESWCLALMRSGEKEKARVAWMDYDSTERHCHSDCMNFGLYANGIDLMADFGYPPVQYGGWDAPKAEWFTLPSAHNTVVVDQTRQPRLTGKSTLWADGQEFRAIRASAPNIAGKQFERTAAMVDISDRDSYVLDVFRVVGGKDHAKFMHTQIGSAAASGLTLAASEDYGAGSVLRNSRTDIAPKPGWSVDWAIDDQFKLATPGPEVHVKYTDLTNDAQATMCEAWVSMAFNTNDEAWIPEMIVRRKSDKEPLASTFVGIIEPYYKTSNIASIRRLPLETTKGEAYSDANVAVEVTLIDGRRDVLICADVENPLGLSPSLATAGVLVQKDTGISLEGEMCLVRFAKSGEVERVALCKGKSIRISDLELKPKDGGDFAEAVRANGSWKTLSK